MDHLNKVFCLRNLFEFFLLFLGGEGVEMQVQDGDEVTLTYEQHGKKLLLMIKAMHFILFNLTIFQSLVETFSNLKFQV